MPHGEGLLALSIFFLFSFLAFGSVIYDIVFLRKHEELELGFVQVVGLYLGDVRNHKRLNDAFVASFSRHDMHPLFNRCVSVLHLVSPLLILASLVAHELIKLIIAR